MGPPFAPLVELLSGPPQAGSNAAKAANPSARSRELFVCMAFPLQVAFLVSGVNLYSGSDEKQLSREE
jgi:hypothetical protein